MAIISGLVLTSCAQKPLKVLMVGNSFSLSCRRYLPRVAASAPDCPLELEIAYIGGCTLDRHMKEYEASAKDASHRPYTDIRDQPANLQELLSRKKWDIISIQQGSHKSWRPASFHPWSERLIEVIRQSNPQAEIIVQQTWSYNSGDPRIHDGAGEWKIDQSEMFRRLDENYRALASENGFRIVPVGLAVQMTRRQNPVPLPLSSREALDALAANTPSGSRLPETTDVVGKLYWDASGKSIQADTIHLNLYGEYLQACVWFGFLFQRPVKDVAFLPEELTDKARVDNIRLCAQEALDGCTSPGQQ